MPVTILNIIPSKHAESSQVTQYTAANATTIIDKFTATNTSSAVATISINLVISGGSAGASNLILDSKKILPGKSYTCPEIVGHVLNENGFISTIASAATSITIRASGREIT